MPKNIIEITTVGVPLNSAVKIRNTVSGMSVNSIGAEMPAMRRFRPRARSLFVTSVVGTMSLILKRLLYKQYRVNSNYRLNSIMRRFFKALTSLLTMALLSAAAIAQQPNSADRQSVRTVSIPISIFTKQELKEDRLQEYIQIDRILVKENNEEQQLLSIRSIDEAPLSLAILVQEGLTSNFNLQIADLKEFIRRLPRGSRVMVAYLRGGTSQIRQRFTNDLGRAADSLRIVSSSASAGPRNPYDGVAEVLDRFDGLPAGRRAVLLISDGVDVSNGIDSASPSQSLDLDRAILRAQRKNVAVFSFYSPTALTENGNSRLVLFGQGSLQKLSDETGGRAFFQVSLAPVSFEPFFRDLSILLNRQFLLTYLSNHMKKGYYKVEVTSTNPEIKVEHPKGYYYR